MFGAKIIAHAAALSGALLFSSAGRSADWYSVMTTKTNSELFVDRESIKNHEGLRMAWFKTDSKRDRTVVWRESKQQIVADCQKGLLSFKQSMYYKSDYTLMDSTTYSEYQWFSPAPETVGENMLEVMCKTDEYFGSIDALVDKAASAINLKIEQEIDAFPEKTKQCIGSLGLTWGIEAASLYARRIATQIVRNKLLNEKKVVPQCNPNDDLSEFSQ